jgi:LCP family protein required for cell wall assembly
MNILLLGVDLREGFPEEGVRSDSLILLHLDPRAGWGSMLSIPRDTVADIPGFGENKINTAFRYGYENAEELFGADTDPTAGGAALAADTVERFLNLADHNSRINYVATINFNGFAQLIDAVGGVEVDVPREIVDTEYPTEDFGYMTLRIPAGRQRMNGETALQYVRTRHADSDFGRAQRQQQVIRALVQALREQPALLRPIAAMRLVNAASDATRTTVPIGRPDALLMSALLARLDPSQLAQYRLDPEQISVQEFGSDLVWDPAGVQAVVREALSPPGEAKEQATIQVQNGVGTAGIATRLTTALARSSFITADPGDSDTTEQSQIIDYGDNPATRDRLSKVLGGMPVQEGSSDEAPVGVDIVVRLGADYEQYWRER